VIAAKARKELKDQGTVEKSFAFFVFSCGKYEMAQLASAMEF